MAREGWPSKDEFRQFLETVTGLEELHLYAGHFNWDCGCEELHRVIQHPLCDRGTALMIYWRGGPRWFARYRDRSEASNPDAARTFDLLREIEKKVMANAFKSRQIHFDPKNDKGYDWTQRHNTTKVVREIPMEMFT